MIFFIKGARHTYVIIKKDCTEPADLIRNTRYAVISYLREHVQKLALLTEASSKGVGVHYLFDKKMHFFLF